MPSCSSGWPTRATAPPCWSARNAHWLGIPEIGVNRPFDHLHTDSGSPALAAALQAAAEAHQQETRATTDEETFDFDAFHDMVVGMELLGWLRIRSWLGHAPPPGWPAPPLHAASALPAGWWAHERQTEADPLLLRVMHRVHQVLPGREMLAREFAPWPGPMPP